jgi:hypothetical protein
MMGSTNLPSILATRHSNGKQIRQSHASPQSTAAVLEPKLRLVVAPIGAKVRVSSVPVARQWLDRTAKDDSKCQFGGKQPY